VTACSTRYYSLESMNPFCRFHATAGPVFVVLIQTGDFVGVVLSGRAVVFETRPEFVHLHSFARHLFLQTVDNTRLKFREGWEAGCTGVTR
jgi:hypothetical protein